MQNQIKIAIDYTLGAHGNFLNRLLHRVFNDPTAPVFADDKTSHCKYSSEGAIGFYLDHYYLRYWDVKDLSVYIERLKPKLPDTNWDDPVVAKEALWDRLDLTNFDKVIRISTDTDVENALRLMYFNRLGSASNLQPNDLSKYPISELRSKHIGKITFDRFISAAGPVTENDILTDSQIASIWLKLIDAIPKVMSTQDYARQQHSEDIVIPMMGIYDPNQVWDVINLIERMTGHSALISKTQVAEIVSTLNSNLIGNKPDVSKCLTLIDLAIDGGKDGHTEFDTLEGVFVLAYLTLKNGAKYTDAVRDFTIPKTLSDLRALNERLQS